MITHIRIARFFLGIFLSCPLILHVASPISTMVVFGDSYSDIGNTTHLLKSLRQEEDPAYLVAPFKAFVLNKMIEFANEYYVPQMVLDAGINRVTQFFDKELAPYITQLVAQIRMVPVLPVKPYWNHRFSNGPVWNEYLARMWSIRKSDDDAYINEAFGGSWAATYDKQLTVWNLIRHPLGIIKTLIVGKLIPPSLGLTVQGYLMAHPHLEPESVYFIFSGMNDYINVLVFEDNYKPAVMSRYVDNVLDNLTRAILKLEHAGAKRFVILGLPHIGNLPRFVGTPEQEVLNAAIDEHNMRLEARIQEWSSLYPAADFLFVNTDQFLAKALAYSEQYGFFNSTAACIDLKFPMVSAPTQSPFARNEVLKYAQVLSSADQFATPHARRTNKYVCAAPDEYLFWDEIHLSTRAHHFLAYEVCTAMKEHGYGVICTKPNSAASKGGMVQITPVLVNTGRA